MSLTVDDRLLEQARQGEVDDAAFVACVRDSLPYAWQVIGDVVGRMRASDDGFADNQVPPPDEKARGELLRALASDAMRGALERHFGVRLAFQNCHRVAAFAPGAAGTADRHARFVSPRAQLLNQSPDLIDC
ncbi:SCO5389 family protein [Actinomadura sp. 21ATH]|uniref:SCO5389 family protein n=1 Tax=Actinomadura sp. 21ATH TaxID=1735444 RepID=UPI0035C05DDE